MQAGLNTTETRPFWREKKVTEREMGVGEAWLPVVTRRLLAALNLLECRGPSLLHCSVDKACIGV